MRIRGLGLIVVLVTVFSISTPAQVLLKKTDQQMEQLGTPVLDDAGTRVFANLNSDPFGTNPQRIWQLAAWDAASGVGASLLDDSDGVSWMQRSVDVSSDASWIAFISPADLTGQNHDESLEIFVMSPDGTNLSQVTNNPGPASTSWIYRVAISGTGDRIAFIADTDPLGGNPDRVPQVFAINRNGSGLIQLTAITAADNPDRRLAVDISDDGASVIFASDADLTGDGPGLFIILDDGTGLQFVASVPYWGGDPYISGDGLHVAYQNGGTATVIDPWRQMVEWVESGRGPTITDDGAFIAVSDDRVDPVQNPGGYTQIWTGSLNGTSFTDVTDRPESDWGPVISGDGNRIAFFQEAEPGESLRAIDHRGNSEVVLTEANDFAPEETVSPDITPDGSRVVYSFRGDLMRLDPDSAEPQQVTSFVDAFVEVPTITSDGETIVFQSCCDPLNLGGNNVTSPSRVYAIEADGSGARLLSGDFSLAYLPVIASNGSFVVFGVDHELYRVRPDGTDLLQLTNLGTAGNLQPRIDSNGEWAVFSNHGIYRVRTDGTGLHQIVASGQYDTHYPDISGSGQQIVWSGRNDPLGSNRDGNLEIFRYDVQTDTIHQVTVTTVGGSWHPRISKDGAWIYFASSTPFFDENPQDRREPYRYEISSGRLERAGGLRRGPSEIRENFGDPWHHIAVDGTGGRAVFTAQGDWTGRNPDFNFELYLVDQGGSSRIEASKTTPTVVTWDADPRYVRYDIIRGDLANVSYDDGTIALGPVSCLEEASPDTDTRGFEDPAQPVPGQVLFYVFRGTQGTGDVVNDWGLGTGGFERIPGTGSCSP